LAVTGLDWEIQPAGITDTDKDIADFVENAIRKIPRLREVMLDIMDAVGKGISISEIDWEIDNSGNFIISGIEWVHPKKLFWDYETDEMKICTVEYPEGISLPENKFVVHRYKAKSGHPSRAGVLRIVAWMYLFKNYNIKDWVAFCEIYGMPLRLGKYNAAASKEDKVALAEAIINLGADAAGIIPETASIEFVESNKTTSADIYESFARYCDEQTSKAIVGQTLTADSGGGSYAQGKVHADVRHDLTVADAQALAETINECIVQPLVLYNFGSAACPTFQFDCKEPEDLKETVEVYKTLVCDMGLKIPEEHVYKKFAIPKPEDGERVLEPPAVNVQPVESGAEPERTMLKMKADMDGDMEDRQAVIDSMTNTALAYSDKIFDKMLQPIVKLLDNETDLSALKKRLEDKDELKKLYEDMESPELNDLLTQAIYLSSLVGRAD
ncbi:MAG: DUF935 domain-containing protein, partial [Lachnospiraceae bacterium]|nr:DUF935 domain-containing protein [Lachnospiraceae bacterium]